MGPSRVCRSLVATGHMRVASGYNVAHEDVHRGRTMTGILLVEDEIDLAHVIARELAAAGFHVRHSADGEAALRAVADEAPELVVLDWMLPGIDGLEVLR